MQQVTIVPKLEIRNLAIKTETIIPIIEIKVMANAFKNLFIYRLLGGVLCP